jgi:hypothetical protein
MREMRSAFRILVRNPKSKRPLGRSRHRWKDIFKEIFNKIGCEGVDWI